MMLAYDHFFNWAQSVINSAKIDVELQPTAERTMLAIYNALQVKKRDEIAQAEAERAARAQAAIVPINPIINNPAMSEPAPPSTGSGQELSTAPTLPEFDTAGYYRQLEADYARERQASIDRYNAQVNAERARQVSIINANPRTATVTTRLSGRTLTILDYANTPNGAIDNEFSNVLNGIAGDGKRISEPVEYTSGKLFGNRK